MNNDAIISKIKAHIPDASIILDGDGYHFEATIISKAFIGLNKIKRSQMVYDTLKEWIASGELHAISLKTLTPEEANNG